MSDFHSAVARDAVAFEAAAALHDIQAAAAERGQEISFQAPEESGVQRSRYNSIKARDLTPLVTMFANSVEYSPSRYTLEKASGITVSERMGLPRSTRCTMRAATN